MGGGPRQGGARRPDSAREQPAWRPCWRRWRGPGHPLRLALHPGVTAAVPPPSQRPYVDQKPAWTGLAEIYVNLRFVRPILMLMARIRYDSTAVGGGMAGLPAPPFYANCSAGSCKLVSPGMLPVIAGGGGGGKHPHPHLPVAPSAPPSSLCTFHNHSEFAGASATHSFHSTQGPMCSSLQVHSSLMICLSCLSVSAVMCLSVTVICL